MYVVGLTDEVIARVREHVAEHSRKVFAGSSGFTSVDPVVDVDCGFLWRGILRYEGGSCYVTPAPAPKALEVLRAAALY